MTVAETLEQIEALPPDDRFSLLCEAWDRLYESGWQPAVDDETLAILEERLAEERANPSNSATWDELVARVKGHP